MSYSQETSKEIRILDLNSPKKLLLVCWIPIFRMLYTFLFKEQIIYFLAVANFKLFRERKELWNFSSSSPPQHLLSRRKNSLPFSSSSSATHRARIHTVASPNNEDTKMIKEFRGFLTKNLLGQFFHRRGSRRHFLAPPTHPRWGIRIGFFGGRWGFFLSTC